MKKIRAHIIFSVFICLWSLNCLAVESANERLFYAVLYGKLNKVKQAINDGADVNLNRGAGLGTPLDTAIDGTERAIRFNSPERYKAFKVLMLLIQKGAHINGLGDWGWTPLMKAISADEPTLIAAELLLSYGADPEGKSTKGKTTLSWAQKRKLEKVLELLTSYPALLQKVKTQPSNKLLRECIEKGRFTLVKLLLQRGVVVIPADYTLAKKKYNETHSMAYEIIGKLLKERLSTTTKLGLISQKGIVGANVVSHSGDYLELTHDVAEHIGGFLPFIEKQ